MAALNLTIAAQYLTVTAQSLHQAYRCTRGSKDQDQRLQVYKQLTLKLNSWLFTYHRTKSNSHRTKFNYRRTCQDLWTQEDKCDVLIYNTGCCLPIATPGDATPTQYLTITAQSPHSI